MLRNGKEKTAMWNWQKRVANLALTQLSGGGVGDPGRPAHHATLETAETLYRFISRPSLVRPLNPMAPRRKCNVCGSQQWHKEPATGLVVCSEGHVLQVCASSGTQLDPLGPVTPWNNKISQNYLNETYETYEHGALQGRRRTLKSTREKRARTSKANPERTHTPYHLSLSSKWRSHSLRPSISSFECSLSRGAGAVPSFPMFATFVEEAGRCIDPALEASD
jgi:hypothetical protein